MEMEGLGMPVPVMPDPVAECGRGAGGAARGSVARWGPGVLGWPVANTVLAVAYDLKVFFTVAGSRRGG